MDRTLGAKSLKMLRKLEWAGHAQGQGYGFMGSGGDGPIFGACPECHGVHESGKHEFTAEAIGHKKNCALVKLIKSLEKENE